MKILAIAPLHGEIAVRCLVIVGVVPGIVFYGVRGGRAIERPAHAASPVGLGDGSMTDVARRGIYIPVVSVGRRRGFALGMRDLRRRNELDAEEINRKRQKRRSQDGPYQPSRLKRMKHS